MTGDPPLPDRDNEILLNHIDKNSNILFAYIVIEISGSTIGLFGLLLDGLIATRFQIGSGDIQVMPLLVQEGLITNDAAKDLNLISKGYREYFRFEEAAARIEPITQLSDALSFQQPVD